MCSRKGEAEVIEIKLEPHRGMRGRCSHCQQPAPGYDRLPERRWQLVPLWGIRTDTFSMLRGEWSVPSMA